MIKDLDTWKTTLKERRAQMLQSNPTNEQLQAYCVELLRLIDNLVVHDISGEEPTWAPDDSSEV